MAVRLSSNISTKNPADVYATHLDNLGKGGVHTKTSIAQMNGITLERRTRLMLCVVADVGNGSPGLYWLNTPSNPTIAQLSDNQYWEPVPLGTTLNGVLTLKGFESAGSLTILDGTGSNGDTYIVDAGGSVNNPNIFGGQAVTLIAGDYLVYEAGIWNIISTGATSVNWNTLTGKPTTFTPTAHTHVITDITDFPDISGFLEDADVVSQIVNGENPLKLANVQAIITYITSKINAIDFPETDLSNYYTQGQVDTLLEAVEGYILYTQPSLTALNTNVQNPEEGAFAYIQGEYSMYRRESNVWVKKYETSLPSSDEAKYLNINVNTIAELKDLGTVSLSLNNYILFRNTDDADALYAYQLVTGTDAEALPDVVRPDDYAASTNEKVWKRAISADDGGIDPADIVNDFSTDPGDSTKVAGADAVYTLFQLLESNDVDYDTLQEIVTFIKTIDTDGELVTAIDTAVGNTDWRTGGGLVVDPSYIALGTSPAIDLDTADVFKKTFSSNVTELAFTNGVEGKEYKVYIQVDATGGYTFDYTTANIHTIDGVPLIIPNDANSLHLFQITKVGTTYLVNPLYDIQTTVV